MNLRDQAEANRSIRELRVRSEALFYLIAKGGIGHALYDRALHFGEANVKRREREEKEAA